MTSRTALRPARSFAANARVGSAAPDRVRPGMAPPLVYCALSSGGQPLEPAVCRSMGHRFSHDFSGVRVHTDPLAAASAQAVQASAYTVGGHVVFNAGGYRPDTGAGRDLLAHELAHVMQQTRAQPQLERGAEIRLGGRYSAAEFSADRLAREPGAHAVAPLPAPTLQRRWFGAELLGLFAGENFPDSELQAYLHEIDTTGKIQDYTDSDNKARAVVRAWSAHKRGYALSQKIKALLIKEMLSGYLSEGDENGILTILLGSDAADLAYIFGTGGVVPAPFEKRFTDDGRKKLHAFFDTRFDGGLAAVNQGHLIPVPPQTDHLTAPDDPKRVSAIAAQAAGNVFDETKTSVRYGTRFARETILARIYGERLAADLRALAPADREKAVKDLQRRQLEFADQANRADEDREADLKGLEKSLDAARKQADAARVAQLEHEVVVSIEALITQVALESAYEELAGKPVPAVKALTPAKAAAAGRALDPDLSSAADAAAGRAKKKPDHAGAGAAKDDDADTAPAPKPPPFVECLPGEKAKQECFGDQIDDRIPDMIDKVYKSTAVGHLKKDHDDPAKTHQLSDIQALSNAAAKEAAAVFKPYITNPQPLMVDRIEKGKFIPGAIHDEWLSTQREADRGGALKKYKIARDLLYYLLENDKQIKGIYFAHHAKPEFGGDYHPRNLAARKVSEVAEAALDDDATVKRLFQIERAWGGSSSGHDIFLQLFKDSDPKADRAAMWDLYLTVIHEYLHTAAHTDYNAYADKLGGESDDRGNTLIEGVDSLLTEIVWACARPRARLTKIRTAVEPDAVKARLPYDDTLVPNVPAERYASYDRAMKLVNVVGVENLYGAYFQGNIKLIGGKK
jgi:Domain of unknown function (DUF4157)